MYVSFPFFVEFIFLDSLFCFIGQVCALASKTLHFALIGVAKLVGHHPTKQKVSGSIPGQGM